MVALINCLIALPLIAAVALSSRDTTFVCGINGYDENTKAYYYKKSSAQATFSACGKVFQYLFITVLAMDLPQK
jgi:hypothetical protein